jgi:hypothetical protein
MKANKNQQGKITGPLLKDVVKKQKAAFKLQMQQNGVGNKPLAQPDLYQDAGNGYNPNFVFPQD